MYTLLLTLLVLDAILLIAVVLLQAGKGGGLAANFGGASSSSDSLMGSRQAGNLLKEPGIVETDRGKGQHADVVVRGGRAWMIYFVHQPGDAEQRKHTVLQAVELQYKGGLLTADRNAPARIDLK